MVPRCIAWIPAIGILPCVHSYTVLIIFLPIVLYNGTPVWNAPLSFYDLLAEMPEELKPYQGIKYLLLDISRLDQTRVDADKGATSVLFKMERAVTAEEYEDVVFSFGVLDEELARMLKLYFITIAQNAEYLDKALKKAGLRKKRKGMMASGIC